MAVNSGIEMDFSKQSFSQNIIDYVMAKLQIEDEKEWFQKMLKGTKLKNAEVNQLIRSLTMAMFMNPEEETTEVNIPPVESLDDDESLSQIVKNGEKAGKEFTLTAIVPTPGTSGTQNIPKNKAKEICRFYGNGKCK